MTFLFGDIYFVRFDPSVGHEYKGDRPAFIAQEAEATNEASVITVIPMSSQLQRMRRNDILIQKDSKNKLKIDSLIKVNHIYTFDTSRFLFKIGAAGSPTIRAVRGYLRRHFGL